MSKKTCLPLFQFCEKCGNNCKIVIVSEHLCGDSPYYYCEKCNLLFEGNINE